ncbi:MAG: hypothetical protein HYS56_03515 [Candidatus Omnitrophica bacterium]|nr:hypothetical protein [Candidatus Omnitrophota bacterium]
MRKTLTAVLGMFIVAGLFPWAFAAEHGGKEHGGTTAAQQTAKSPSKDDIRNAMQAYVAEEAKKTGGNFEVVDPDTGNTRRLQLIRVHERVGKTGNYYYSCADFKDVDTGEALDLDLDVEDRDGKLQVADVRVHKVGGAARFTYDENDNRIPLTNTESHLKSALPGGKEHKGSAATQEHGGKEHGGSGMKEHGGQ